MSNNPRSVVNCSDFQALLNEWLDGRRDSLDDACSTHRSECRQCQGLYFAAMSVTSALAERPKFAIPDGLTDRIVFAVTTENVRFASPVRRSIPWAIAFAALAASVALAIMLRPADRREQAYREVTVRPRTPPVSIGDSLAEAGSAIAALTRRTADQTLEPSRKMLATDPIAPKINLGSGVPDPVGPTAESLDQIRSGAASGFEPVANSARRAFAMFVPASPGRLNRKGNP